MNPTPTPGKGKEIMEMIELKIKEVESRLDAGKVILIQCRQQVSNLKKLLKEYKSVKNQVENKISSSASDGDL